MLKHRKKCIHPELGEISVEYSPRRSRVAVSITIENDTPAIILKLPSNPYSDPEKFFPFLTEHRKWIQKKFTELKQKTVNHTYEPGDIFYYLGKPCPLVQDSVTFFDGSEFHVSAHSPVLIKREIEKLYRRLAVNYIPILCHQYAEKFGLTIGEIRINNAAKRWGSCNSRGDLNFSFRLMMRSEEFIKYTICHELAHRLHMNHSKAFYAALKRFYPFPPPEK